jgi:hypothetical protein
MNILNFPDFTLVNRVVPKVAFYSHLEVTARMKSAFVENVEQVVWLYKLAPSNLHVADGKAVHELTIFLIKLKNLDFVQYHILLWRRGKNYRKRHMEVCR